MSKPSSGQLRHLFRLLAEDKIAGEALQEIIESHEILVVSQITKKMLRQTRTFASKIKDNHSRAMAFIRIFCVSDDFSDLKNAYRDATLEEGKAVESDVYWHIKVLTKIYSAVECNERTSYTKNFLNNVCPEIPSSGHLLKQVRELAEALKEPYWNANSWIVIFSASNFNEDLDMARQAVRRATKNVGQKDSVLKSFAIALADSHLTSKALKVANSILPYDYQSRGEALAAVAKALAKEGRLKDAREAASKINNPNWLVVAFANIYAKEEDRRDLRRAREVNIDQAGPLFEIYAASREPEDLIRARGAALECGASDRVKFFAKIAAISHEAVDFTEAEKAIPKITVESSLYPIENRMFEAWISLAEAMRTRYLF